jgi:hypothetical protein
LTSSLEAISPAVDRSPLALRPTRRLSVFPKVLILAQLAELARSVDQSALPLLLFFNRRRGIRELVNNLSGQSGCVRAGFVT